MPFVFAHVDIFGSFRVDVLTAALAGKIAGNDIGQMFLALTTLYVAIRRVMIFLTLVLPRRVRLVVLPVLGLPSSLR